MRVEGGPFVALHMHNAHTAIRLTQYAKGAGCGCKLAPGVLDEILAQLPRGFATPNLLVGTDTRDDAAAYDLGNGTALIATTDFFTPVVDDPADFGAIAAANAISDVYAMGGQPLLALAILGWPVEKLPTEAAGRVLAAATQLCAEAGIPLAGGHSIESPEPFFGLAVNGIVPTAHLKRNRGAQPGDVILITKPLGTGLVTTALKRGLAQHEHVQAAIAHMKSLNRAGTALGQMPAVHALTDVTGFGLAGHLLEMTGDALDAEIEYTKLPLLPGTDAYMQQDAYSDGTMRNMRSYGNRVTLPTKESFYIACDPQTNGGLLVACAPADVAAVQASIRAATPNALATVIGYFKAGDSRVFVKN